MGSPGGERETGRRQAAGRRARLVIRVCAFNVLAFGLVALLLGGDALVGGGAPGRYFLSDRGTLTEVSRGTWRYSRAHSLSIWFSIPALLGAMLAARRFKEPGPDRLLMPVLLGGTAALVLGELLKARPGPATPGVAAATLLGGTVAGAGVALLARMWKERRAARTGGPSSG